MESLCHHKRTVWNKSKHKQFHDINVVTGLFGRMMKSTLELEVSPALDVGKILHYVLFRAFLF